MNYNKGRLAKTADRALWSGLAAFKPKPHRTLLHRREIPGKGEKNLYEFVYRCDEPAYIEPIWGYIITGRGVFLADSLATHYVDDLPNWVSGLPSPLEFYRQKPYQAATTVHYPLVVSLRFPWEWNYYHFYLDVLAKLNLIDALGIDRSTPLVLGKYAHELSFVKEIIGLGEFKRRNWVIQEENYVAADQIIYCRSKQDEVEKSRYLVKEMQLPDSPPDSKARLFLTRSQTSNRHIVNAAEIEKIVTGYGFEIADSGVLTLAEQMALFSKARYIVGIHGAGLTNVIFRKNAPLGLLELHASNYHNVAHKAIVEGNGGYWDHLPCSPDDTKRPASANFTVLPAALTEKIERLLAS